MKSKSTWKSRNHGLHGLHGLHTVVACAGIFVVIAAAPLRIAYGQELPGPPREVPAAPPAAPTPIAPSSPIGPTPAAPLPPPYYYTPGTDDGPPANTVLGTRVSHGGFGAPELKLSTLAGEGVMLAGAQGAWILGHSLSIGAAGYANATNVVAPTPLQPIGGAGDARMGIAYGGVRLGGILGQRKMVHFTFGALLGGGGATAATRDGWYHRSDSFWVLEPDVAAEINLAAHVRFALGGSFRIVGGTNEPGFTPTRLSGPAAGIGLKFGEF